MTLNDDISNLVREVSGTGLSATAIGAQNRSSEELSKPFQRSKSSEDCYFNPTRDIDDRGHEEPRVFHGTDGKKQRYSAMSAEVCFIKDRPVFHKKITKKTDVRYVNVKQKVKSSGFLTCGALQERLNQHKHIHHHKYYKKTDYACGTRIGMRDRGINVSPMHSRMRLHKFHLPLIDEVRGVQTDITMKDFSPTRLFTPKPATKATSDHTNNAIPLRKTETRDILPKRNFYKEHLYSEVLDWLHHVPMFFSLNFTTQDIKDSVVNDLVEKINILATEAKDKAYEIKTKMEIDDCLNQLPMWLHGPKQEQALYKESLKEQLWIKISGLNKIFLGVTNEEAVGGDIFEEKAQFQPYEKELVQWSLKLLLDPEEPVSRRQVVDLLIKRLSPLLKIPLQTTSYKLLLKGEIIDILDDLPLIFTSPRYKTVQLNKLAEELATKLMNHQIKQETSSSKNAEVTSSNEFHKIASQVMGLPIPKPLYHDLIRNKVGEFLDKLPVCNRNELKSEICSTFLDSKFDSCAEKRISIKDEICQHLRDIGKTTGEKTHIIANMIINQVNDIPKEAKKSITTSFDSVMPQSSGVISVYRWESENPPATSTPKKAQKKEVPKLSSQETTYLEKVAALVTLWMNTLPKQYNDEPGFKRTVIYDLAGDIMDHQKLLQLAPDAVTDKEKYQKYLIYKWLCKFDFFAEDKLRTESVPLVADFQRRLKDIPVPNLTAPQHGTRQEMEYIKHMEGERGWAEDYVAKGIDVLEDQISIWMNEQPSEIYSNKDKAKRNKMVHELALNLQDHLRNKHPESEIEADINQWLNKMVSSKEKEHIGLLTQGLKEKVIQLPQDQTLGARHEERQREIVAKIAAKRQQKAGAPSTQHEEEVSNLGNIQGDPDKTIREFIGKYIEHYYDIDDPMATGAFAHLLKTELRKLAPLTRKEVYENFEQSKTHQRFRPESLNKELEYIKIISDWLNQIPIEPAYNTVGNKRRIEFITDLARDIQEIEEQRLENPDAMEYNYLIASTIVSSMHTYDLPILSHHKNNTAVMAHRLLEKLVDIRPVETYVTQTGSESLSSSAIMSDIKEQNLSDFINDYIRINGREIADDELKLEAWTARLLKEIKKMVHEGTDPSALTKAQVYEKFAAVSIPTKESVEAFSLKIHYVKEITDWMKNLPLLSIKNKPEHTEERIKMISELSEKMCETEALKRAHPSDDSADKELVQYIATWISSLPLDKNKDINLPILIQQLMTRMGRGNKQAAIPSLENQPPTKVSPDKIKPGSPSRSEKNSKMKKIENKGDSKRIISKERSKDSQMSSKSIKGKNPAEVIVEAIETWSNKLPIKLDDKDAVKPMKEAIARQLYQKIGELNVDPRIFNDELLYREMLDDEIETQLENVPQNSELQQKREHIKEGLINQIIGTNKIIKEKSAGDNYRHKLETTIDASIPNPVQSVKAFDPGFEIYKNHLADMFILENFDHANDDVKASYEKRVRQEIDKYFASAQNKNAFPLTKDQIYNEIYSGLFKVPMPNETSVIDEVEQVKTRCEIDAWYENLPIQETDNLNELLERDQILSTLAKRIHEIEKNGDKVDENINKEIRKWLEKLPFKSGQKRIDEHVKQLQSLLKTTSTARKYVPPVGLCKGKSLQAKQVKQSRDKKGTKDLNTSQAPGPSSAPPRPKTAPSRSSPLESKATTAKPCCPVVSQKPNKKPGDLIVEIVEEWCNNLPLISTEENNKAIIDNISTRIIIQISEFNMDSEIFNDDVIYDELLDEELEKVMSNLPVCCDFEKSKNARKFQLKEQIKSIKPLIKDEKARHEYIQELNNTVAIVLKEPRETPAEKLAIFNKLKDEIVENFVQYYYHRNDEASRQYYKNQIHDGVVKFCIAIRDNQGTCEKLDPLVRRNQLLCELQKIPVPQSALEEEVAEIRMKKEVQQFMQELSIPDGDSKDTMTKHLAKRLCDIEKSGYSPSNEKKMKSDIMRCVTKLKKDVNPDAAEGFISKLKHSEAERKVPPMTTSQASNLNQDGSGFPKPYGTSKPVISVQGTSQTSKQSLVPFKTGDENYVSIPGMPMQGADYHTPVSMHAYGPQIWAWSPNEERPQYHLGPSPAENAYFGADNILASSAAHQGAPRALTPAHLRNVPDGPPMNLNVSLGSAQPNLRLTQQTLSKSFPQYQLPPSRMREATSSPIRPSFGQTPRQVRQSPHAPQTQVPSLLRDISSDSLFQAPIFEPVPFSFLDPFKLAGSRRKGARRTGSQNAKALPMQAGRPKIGDRIPGMVESSEDDDICICDRCSLRNRRGIPFYLMPMDQNFEDCLGIPMLYGMHFPDCFFYSKNIHY